MMRKAVLLISMTCVGAALSYAGPESYSDKDMKQVAPAPAPGCGMNWTGFYIGAFGAYSGTLVDPGTSLTGDWQTLFPVGKNAVEHDAPDNLNHSGAEVGGLLGYNYQWNNWVFGAEAAGGYLWSSKSDYRGPIAVPNDPFDAYDLNSQFKTRFLTTFTPKIGYSFCKWMPYVTGGLAVGQIDYDQQLINVLSPVQGPFTYRNDSSKDDTRVGWTVGGGLEYALTNHWHLRGQYLYVDLGSESYTSPGMGAAPFPVAPYTVHHDVDLREHNASLALIYKF